MRRNPLFSLILMLGVVTLACNFPLAASSQPADDDALIQALSDASTAERLKIMDGNEDGATDWMSYSFPEEQLAAGLYMQPMIATDLTYGNAFRQDLAYNFRNETAVDQQVELETDIPKEFAASVDELWFSMTPLEIVNPDPVARFGFSVPANSSPVAYLLIRGPEKPLSADEEAERVVAKAMLSVAAARCTKTMHQDASTNQGLQGMCYFDLVQGYAGFIDNSLLETYCEKIKGDWNGICLSIVRPDTTHCEKIENKINNALCTGMFITQRCSSIPLETRELCIAEGAIELKSVGGCAAIQYEDIRNDCLARVKDDPRYCDKIIDEELKSQCVALARDKIDYVGELFERLANSESAGMFSSDEAEARCKSFSSLTAVFPLIKSQGMDDMLNCFYGTEKDKKNDDFKVNLFIRQYASQEEAASDWADVNGPDAVWLSFINSNDVIKESMTASAYSILEQHSYSSEGQQVTSYTLHAGELVGKFRVEYIEKYMTDSGEGRWADTLARVKQLVSGK